MTQLRFTQRVNADRPAARYAALAHNRPADGKIRPDVLMNISRADQLDMDGLPRPAPSTPPGRARPAPGAVMEPRVPMS